MSEGATPSWRPTRFLRFEESFGTSTGPSKIITDAGRAIIKALGNKEGPHALVCEWIGTEFAAWLGLPTFDLAIMRVKKHDEIPLGHDRVAEPGPAIVARWEDGEPWHGDADSLAKITNPESIAGFVVLDTWIRNPDRHPPASLGRRTNFDNVFLSLDLRRTGPPTLKAIDHTTCIAGGRDLTVKVAHLESISDDAIYGLFPAFRPFVTRDMVRSWIARLTEFDRTIAQGIVDSIPTEWSVTTQVRVALVELLSCRAGYVERTIESGLERQMELETGKLWL